MFSTNKLDYLKDLNEVVFMFTDGSDIDISHNEEIVGTTFIDDFKCDGKDYHFENEGVFNDDIVKKRLQKKYSKLGLYEILCEKYNTKLPWGALTGVRPTKMARDLGINYKERFKDEYFVSDEKIQLTEDVLSSQERYYDRNSEYSCFYVGIPFCPSRCIYCSFMSEEYGRSKLTKEYAKTLAREIIATGSFTKNIRSIYMGGGTPLSMNEEELEIILNAVDKINNGYEFTVEAGRPDCITKSKLDLLKKHNVTRVCVNPQSFNDETLKLIGRKHTKEDTLNCFKLVRTYNFDINMDLIAGFENETFDDFKSTLDLAISLNPDNITVHTLCLKKGAKLKEKESRIGGDSIGKMIEYSNIKLKESGYYPYYLYRQKYMVGNYENVGYTKPNKECIYNIDVMEEKTANNACGAGSVSKNVCGDQLTRYGNPKDVKTYIDKFDEIIEEKKKLYNV